MTENWPKNRKKRGIRKKGQKKSKENKYNISVNPEKKEAKNTDFFSKQEKVKYHKIKKAKSIEKKQKKWTVKMPKNRVKLIEKMAKNFKNL